MAKQKSKKQTECGETFSITPAKSRQLNPEEEKECRRLVGLSFAAPCIAELPKTALAKMTDEERVAFFESVELRTIGAICLADASKDKELAAEREQLATKRNQLQNIAENITKDLAAETPSPVTPKGETIPPTEYSLPLMMKKWGYIFGISPNKLRELRRNKTYHFDKVHSRGWRLPKHEIPAEYLEEYRQHTSQSQPKT